MEERRLLLAVALSFLVLIGYRVLFPPPPPPEPSPEPVAAEGVRPGEEDPPRLGQIVEEPTAVATATPTPTPAPSPIAAIADEAEKRVEVEGMDLLLAFSNRGARLLSWRLKDYTDTRGEAEEMVRVRPGGLRPLDLETGDETLDARLREVLFRASTNRLEIGASQEGELRFEYSDAEIQATKRLRFQPEGYLVEIEAEVLRGGVPLPTRVVWGPGVGNPSKEEQEVFGYQDAQAVLMGPQGLERRAVDDIGASRVPETVRWAGVEAMYFTALWVPREGRGVVQVSKTVLPGAEGEGEEQEQPTVSIDLEAGGALLYVGPKDYNVLAQVGYELQSVVPVGDWIGPVVVPLMKLLRWVHGHVGNYGWSIVLLTVLINMVMAPLRHYSIANGIKMAKLAPEMKVIQERYRKVPALDPRRQEMQKEIAALYARHGMSMSTQMMVGCLPLLLTMPFLIAFYRVLMVSIDLRGASFLWIPDLSHKDPLYVTPVLMGVSMLAMQKMTPSTMDPAQQRIMLIMPLVLVVMFFAAPAGLNLYWLASNLCSVLQQGVTLKILRGREATAPAPRKAQAPSKKERRRK